MAYMPPEQLTDFRDVRPPADVFGMGATFYEMLTGSVPYNFGSEGDSLKIVTKCDIVPIRSRGRELPDGLVTVLEKCLQANPADRYQDAGELAAALREAM